MSHDIYVDDLRKPHRVEGLRVGVWSHMFCHPPHHDTLVAFAVQIGLRAEHIQHPNSDKEHFDITESKRKVAIKLGAKPITVREGARLRKSWRDRYKTNPNRTGADH